MTNYIQQLPANIQSGFSHLATRRDDNPDGTPFWDDELNPKYDDPYYVCIIWNNGAKLPLPIMLSLQSGDADEQDTIDQQLEIIDQMASYSGVMEAKKACREYLTSSNRR